MNYHPTQVITKFGRVALSLIAVLFFNINNAVAQHSTFISVYDPVVFSDISHNLSFDTQIFNSQPVDTQSLSAGQYVATTDTLDQNDNKNNCGRFSWKQTIVPAVLLGAGLVGAINEKNGVNKAVRDCMNDWSGSHTCKVDDYLRFLPSAAYLGLGFIPGVKSKHNTRDRFLVVATSHASMLLLGYGFKHIIKEPRPDMSDRKSFPSGHVALAFTGAELMRIEYGNTYGLGGYLAAGAVAFLRLYNNKHWLNDVVMGAGIGILSARIGYWLLPLEQKLFGINKKRTSTNAAVLPSYDPLNQSVGVSLVAQF